MAKDLETFMDWVKSRNPNEPEFHQAVHEVANSLIPFINENPEYERWSILERLTEPDRVILFRVSWVDDQNQVQVNKGYRVQFNNAIGPYKGGLRFHQSVNLSVLKFLGFEQIFKNSLTTLPLGGAKGGSDFTPMGKSDGEVMRFCQSFMTELHKHIGSRTDVPAGDIGVSSREIGYMFGQYKRLQNEFKGILTGKSIETGGSLIRPEATGYGTIYFTRYMLNAVGKDLAGMKCNVSGSGNVAQFAIQKILQLGGTVHTLSDSNGSIYDPDGITLEKLEWIKYLKQVKRGRIKEYAKEFKCKYISNDRPWKIPCDAAFPCATQNEVTEADAKILVKNGLQTMGEGANMPCTLEASDVFRNAGVIYGPAKAANAGGVAVSGLEMSQNSMRMSWSADEVEDRLKEIMRRIHDKCVRYGASESGIDYVKGANVAGFVKVADAMISEGVI